jgi:hypothetical protein
LHQREGLLCLAANHNLRDAIATGILVADLRRLRDELALLKAKYALARECDKLLSSQPGTVNMSSQASHEQSDSNFAEAMKSQRVRIAHAKLDLEDRLNKRRQKEHRRCQLADGLLKEIVAALQLAAMLSALQHTPCGPPSALVPGRCKDKGASGGNEDRDGLHAIDGAQGRPTSQCNSVRRRHRMGAGHVFSDAEIKSLLKSND